MSDPAPNGTPTRPPAADDGRGDDALRRSEERYRALVEATTQAVWSWSPGGNTGEFARTQQWWENLTGQPVAEQGRDATAWLDVVHPDDREATRLAWVTALASGTKYDIEYRVRERGGGWRHVHARGVPIRNADGSVREWVGTLDDTTDRRRAEAELRQSEYRFRRLASAGIMGVIRWDLDRSLILDANDEFLRMTGYDRADVAAGRLDFRAMTPPEWTARNEVGIRDLRETGVGGAYEKEYFRKDGSRVPVIIVGVRFEDTPREGMSFVLDITERKRAEGERRRLAESLELAVAAADLGTWVWDPATDGITLSDRAAEIYGVSPNRVCTREWMRGLLHPDHRERARAEAARAVAERTEYDIEYQLARPGPVWLAVRGRGVYDATGALTRMLGVVQDVTERKKAEEENRRLLLAVEAEGRRLADVFRHAPSFMCVLRGPAHVFERANDRYFELVGRQYIIGRTVREAVPEAEGQGYFETLDRVYQTGEPFAGTDSRITLWRGGVLEERFVDFVYQPLRDADGAVSGIIVQGIDLTERRRAERDLVRVTVSSERQRRMFETALTNTADFVYLFDLDGRFTYVNKALLDLWGKALGQAVGKNFFDLGYPPDLAARLQGQIREVIDTRHPVRDETPYTSASGTRAYEYILVPVIGAAGEVEAVAGSTRDITERKEAELALRESDRKKDDFIALLAHELRNPLAPIRSGLQVIRLAGGEGPVARARDMMDRQLSHMVRLIDDLLDVSRIGRNKMDLRRARVSLADVVGSAVEAARPLIDGAGHQLAVALPARPVFLDADLTRLAQVFSNLLTNSAKYTERGGRIWLSADAGDGRVVVTVRDTGIGIPAASLATVFDMFSQVDRSIERSTGGLGIGLALVKGLVEMHGGTVVARSEGPGRGSEFVVTLPRLVDDSATVADTSIAGVGGPAQPKRRILVVDDNRDGAESLADLLLMLGNQVETAHDGLEAVERAGRFRPEVILMDVGMPRLNGYEATRRIREQPWGQAIRIIALTGWGQESDRQQTREAGCDGHLVKPVSLPDLEDMLAGRSADGR